MEQESPLPPPLPHPMGSPTAVPAWKAYSPGQVLLATAVGSSAAGGWLLAQNFRRVGEPKRATAVLLLGMLLALLAVGIGMAGLVRAGLNGLSIGLAIGYHYYAKVAQGPMIGKHVASGGLHESWWKALGVGVLSMAAILALGVAGVMAAATIGVPIPE